MWLAPAPGSVVGHDHIVTDTTDAQCSRVSQGQMCEGLPERFSSTGSGFTPRDSGLQSWSERLWWLHADFSPDVEYDL